MPKLHIVNLEEKHKQDMEESSSNVSESTMNAEDDKKAPSMAGLLAPKSLHDRICETAESVTFEVINLDLIICWKISIKMSLTSSISKDDVTAISKVGEKVREEDIKCIAENTPKGASFLRHFIENVDEYVQRIEKKIKFRRGDKS
ncbi:hypothetical protein NQ314_007149 [Rhamnusium bicolor]|uniref:Uncharacterized protein n=1 Tax=Rhamnusium bicolor TaxID=1586634 RepID=A0AAV8YRE1_9CUCU|nr:hypothetical protein NQ314_007149 [Rhamnusium bicolor]